MDIWCLCLLSDCLRAGFVVLVLLGRVVVVDLLGRRGLLGRDGVCFFVELDVGLFGEDAREC